VLAVKATCFAGQGNRVKKSVTTGCSAESVDPH